MVIITRPSLPSDAWLLTETLFTVRCDYRFTIHSKGTALLQLAVGLVMELGLNKPPITSDMQKHNAMVNEAFPRLPGFNLRRSYGREDMRTLLGTFYCATL